MSDRTTNRLGWGGVLVVTLVVLSILLGGGIYSDGGRDPGNGDHAESIPAGVVQFTAADYLITDRSIDASRICFGTSTGTAPVDAITTPALLHGALFVACDTDQHWNDHRPHTINFGQGVAALVQTPMYLIGVGVVLVLSLLPGIVSGTADVRKARRDRKFQRANIEDERRELRISYANEEISEAQFENGLNRLYKLGVKREPASV